MKVKDAVPAGRSTWYTPLGTTVMLSATNSFLLSFHSKTELPGKF
jgi:hypothetical protein